MSIEVQIFSVLLPKNMRNLIDYLANLEENKKKARKILQEEAHKTN